MNSKNSQLTEGLFSRIVDNAPNSVIVFDSAGCVRYWNRAAQRALEFSDQSYGKNVFDLIEDPLERLRFKDDFERFRVEGASLHAGKRHEIKAIKSNGASVWVDFCWIIIDTGHGKWGYAVLGDVEHRKQKEIRLQHEATTDFLSGICNRRQFQHVLDASSAANTCLGIIDIDHFKRINDQYGHLVGDQGIQFVAQYLMKNFESATCVARLGGEEFGVVLEIDNLNEAMAQFEKFRCEIESHTFSEHQIRLTVSIGLTTTACRPFDSHQLIGQADRALFSAKESGRNQIRMAPEDPDQV